MGRPLDLERRALTLARAADYVLENGLTGMSLRPLALALGTSTRMLLYDFSSKEELITAILGEIRRREEVLLGEHLRTRSVSTVDLVGVIWDWISAPEQRAYLQLFFQVYVDAIARPKAYGGMAKAMVTDWLDAFVRSINRHDSDKSSEVTATLIVAVFRGLLLDELVSQDTDRVQKALKRFTQLMSPAPSTATRSDF